MKRLTMLIVAILATVCSTFSMTYASEFNFESTKRFVSLLDKNSIYYVSIDGEKNDYAESLAIEIEGKLVHVLFGEDPDTDTYLCIITSFTDEYDFDMDKALETFITVDALNSAVENPFKYSMDLDSENSTFSVMVRHYFILDGTTDYSEIIYKSVSELVTSTDVANQLISIAIG